MRELFFVGVSGDTTKLLFTDADGAQFSTQLDDRLITSIGRRRERAVRLVSPDPGQTGEQTTGRKPTRPQLTQRQQQLRESTLVKMQTPTPRSIQEQVRRGRSVADIASAAGVPEDNIARFARTVLIERSHMCEQAQRAYVRSATNAQPLRELLLTAFTDQQADMSLASFDAWQHDDGRWVLYLAHPGLPSSHWLYDATTSTVIPADEHAQQLVSIVTQPLPAAPATPTHQRSTTTQAAQTFQSLQSVPGVDSKPSEDTTTTGSSSNRWDHEHPAARAHARKQAEQERAGQAREPAETPPAVDTAATQQGAQRLAKPSPSWEELLFGPRSRR